MDNNTLINLFKTYALPLLDYVSVIYSSHCLMLIGSIESVQRHFTISACTVYLIIVMLIDYVLLNLTHLNYVKFIPIL